MLTVVAVLAAPLIVDVYTLRLSSAEAAAQAEVAVPLLRLLLPQILFYGLMTLGTALLNARRSFFAPAYAPMLNNVVVIGVLLAFAAMVGQRSLAGRGRRRPEPACCSSASAPRRASWP